MQAMKSCVFWDIGLCNPLKINQFNAGFFFDLPINPEDRDDMILRSTG
jgi:hypothetical protein